MQKPIIPLTLAYIAGLLLGHGFLYFPYSVTIAVFLGIFIIGILVRLHTLSLRCSPLLILPGLIGIAAYVYSAVWLPAEHYIRILPPDSAHHRITGEITSPLDRDPDRTGFVLAVSDIDGKPATGRLRVSVREALISIGSGDVVRVSGKIYQPRGFNNPGGFDYPAYLARSGIYRSVSVKNAGQIEVILPGKGMFRAIQDRRERIRQSFLASLSGPGSAILQAMVLGEEGGLTDELRERFLAAGVTHIISISGSHLGMVAVVCFGLIRLLMRLMPERLYHRLTIHADPKKLAAWLTLPLVIFYTLLAGGQVATVRSLMMIAAALAALILDRENALLHSLATAALLILIAGPQAVFDISFQFSFISVLSIGFVVLLWNDIGMQGRSFFEKLRNGAALMAAISLSTSFATGPLAAHYFNQLSLVGIISNMVVVPFAGMVVVPLGLFSGILSLFSHHLPMVWLNQVFADAFISTVTFFSRLPLAEFHPPSPGILRLFCYGIFTMSLAVLIRMRLLYHVKPLEYSSRISRLLLIVLMLSGIFLLIGTARGFLPKRNAELSFPDVGQGDSALIQLSTGGNILIDGGGTYDNRFDIGRRVLAPYLWNRSIKRLDLVILSHPQSDHMNGLVYILKKFDVGEVWMDGQESGSRGYRQFMTAISERNLTRKIKSAEDPPVRLGNAEIRVLHPSTRFRSQERMASAAENDRSLVVRIACGGRVLLFTGDIGARVEKELLRAGVDVKCDLLKAPHHGSKSSSTPGFVAAVRPRLVAVTAGKGNPYRHPSAEVLLRYEQNGATIYRTDRDGAIIMSMSDREVNTVTWEQLTLKRVDPNGSGLLWDQERENWKRLWLSKREL